MRGTVAIGTGAGAGIELGHPPYDAPALEEALRLRDTIPGTRVRVTSIAMPAAERVVRECAAVGADEVVHLLAEGIILF